MKTYLTEGLEPESQVGAALESLAKTIHARREAGEESYTYRLLNGNIDTLLKKLVEEAHETTLAAKDVEYKNHAAEDVNHFRYEAADVVYHLLVLLDRMGVELDEFAAELNSRMTEDEIKLRSGVVLLKPEHINRGR